MVFEAIPGCAMQLYVILETLQTTGTGGVSNQAVLSLVMSALSTGFSSSTITFDFDTSAVRRKAEPEFYGFIPDGTRGTVVFGCMIFNGALLLLARSASAALLMQVRKSYFLCVRPQAKRAQRKCAAPLPIVTKLLAPSC
jgi:hypothetical protein